MVLWLQGVHYNVEFSTMNTNFKCKFWKFKDFWFWSEVSIHTFSRKPTISMIFTGSMLICRFSSFLEKSWFLLHNEHFVQLQNEILLILLRKIAVPARISRELAFAATPRTFCTSPWPDTVYCFRKLLFEPNLVWDVLLLLQFKLFEKGENQNGWVDWKAWNSVVAWSFCWIFYWKMWLK